MANRLEKVVQIVGGGGAVDGGDFIDVGGEVTPDKPLPPVESKCYEDLFTRVQELWPTYIVTRVVPDKGSDYFRVSDIGGGYVWRVTGVCKNGYIEISYKLLQSPGIGSN